MRLGFAFSLHAVLLLLLGIVLVLSDDATWMVGGSEVSSFLVTPAIWVQVVCFAVCALSLLLPARKTWRILRYPVFGLAAILGGHRLVVNDLHHRLEDVYLQVRLQRLELNPRSERGLVARPVRWGFLIGPTDDDKRFLRIVSPPVVGLNAQRLAEIPQ